MPAARPTPAAVATVDILLTGEATTADVPPFRPVEEGWLLSIPTGPGWHLAAGFNSGCDRVDKLNRRGGELLAVKNL